MESHGGKADPSNETSFRYLLGLVHIFLLSFFVDISQISFKYIQTHHPLNISIKRLENIFIKITCVRYLKCIIKK